MRISDRAMGFIIVLAIYLAGALGFLTGYVVGR
jgi:hypothetical protein